MKSWRKKTRDVADSLLIFVANAVLLFLLMRAGLDFVRSFILTGAVFLTLTAAFSYGRSRKNRRKLSPLDLRRKQRWDQVRAIASKSRTIREPNIALCARDIAKTAASILRKADKHPERHRLLHRYFDYYLQTTLSILNRCETLTKSPVFDREMDRQIQEAEQALRRLNRHLNRQMLNLLKSEVWELEIERKTLEKLMAESNNELPPAKGERHET